MLVPARRLSDRDLAALDDLERRVVQADGGRLKLERGTLQRRAGDQVCDLLWWEGGALQGFAGLYAYGPSVEVAGAVAPGARRRGTGGRLLDEALGLCAQRGLDRALLVVPGGSAGGAALARARGGTPGHSEHALVLAGDPAPTAEDPALRLRRAGPVDAPAVGRLLEQAFGRPAPALAQTLADPSERTLLAERDGAPVATVRLALDGPGGGVYGLAVDPAQQGRGCGRDVLARACRLLRRDGARQVGLEVAVDNARALRLYTSLGFVPVTTEDYWSLPTRRPPA